MASRSCPSPAKSRSRGTWTPTAADFSNEDEVIHPGYHKVVLKNYGITAELTSTTRVGFHRYQFPKDQVPKVIFNTGATLMAPIA